VAVASAGPYASRHLGPDREPRQHPTTQFFTGRMPFLPPNQQRQSTEGIKYDDPQLKKSHSGCALVRHFQPRVHHIWMSDSLLCIISIMLNVSMVDNSTFLNVEPSTGSTFKNVELSRDYTVEP